MNISIDNNTYDLSNCSKRGNTIILGYEFKYAKKILSDNDFNMFISDTITHELLHSILIKEFNLTTSKLFDTIEHLICNFNIKKDVFKFIRKCKKSKYPITWYTVIISSGFKPFLENYHIDKNDINQAYIICSSRLKEKYK